VPVDELRIEGGRAPDGLLRLSKVRVNSAAGAAERGLSAKTIRGTLCWMRLLEKRARSL
jgi:hypothetical protein